VANQVHSSVSNIFGQLDGSRNPGGQNSRASASRLHADRHRQSESPEWVPRIAVLAALLFLTSCADVPESTSPPTLVPSSTSYSARPSSTPTPTPTETARPTPVTQTYRDVAIKVIDDVATTGDLSDKGDDCDALRASKGRAAILVDDEGRRVAVSKVGGGRIVDSDSNCGVTAKFPKFASVSARFTLRVRGLKVRYDAVDLPKPEVKTLPNKWTKGEAGYLKWNVRQFGKDDSGYDLDPSTVAGAYEKCAEITDFANSRDQLEYLIEEGADTDSFFKAAVRYLCSDAKGVLNEVGRGFADGTYDVGDEIKPGTYRTGKKTSDCYWSRTSSSGDITANDFVSYAPAGVTVTIFSSDGGFESDGCRAWVRIS